MSAARELVLDSSVTIGGKAVRHLVQQLFHFAVTPSTENVQFAPWSIGIPFERAQYAS